MQHKTALPLIAASFLFMHLTARGQDAVEMSSIPATNQPIPNSDPTETTVQSSLPAESSLHNVSSSGADEISSQPRRFKYGLRVTVEGVYDDNINLRQTNRVSDYFMTIDPVLTLGAGEMGGEENNYIRFDYAPSVIIFVDHSEDDALQQLIHLEGQHHFAHLTLSLREDIAVLDGTDLRTIGDASTPASHVNLDVSGRARFETYRTLLNASYDLTGKTFLSSGLDSLVTEYNTAGLISSEMISGNIFVNYRYSEKMVIGLGGTGGYDLVDAPNPDQTFEQANAHATYQATGKVSFDFSGGVEFRQFENSSRGQYVSPVFELGLTYQPSDGTTINLSGSRRTLNSGVLAGQDFATTTFNATVRQRLLQRIFVTIAGGYQNSDYFSTVSSGSAGRSDNYYFIEPAVDLSVTRFWTVGGYYLHRQNESSLHSFVFSDDQVGVRTALTF